MRTFALLFMLAAIGSFLGGSPHAELMLKGAAGPTGLLVALSFHRFMQLQAAGVTRDLQHSTALYAWEAAFWLGCSTTLACCLILLEQVASK